MNLEDTAMSFQEWSDAGYRIKKGSKSRSRDILGVPQFTIDQVFRPDEPPAYSWEEADKRARAKGTPHGVIQDFDSFVREAGKLPDLINRPKFKVSDPVEMHFMDIADKHGVFDRMFQEWEEDDHY
jgi:hypothetical protein